jgi:c-di-GMP-binding flagellar brake protein YcgR
MSANRRIFPRIACNVNVDYRLSKESTCPAVQSRSKDLSCSGIRLIGLEKFNIGDCLTLHLELPDTGAVIEALGKIVWIDEFQVGSMTQQNAFDMGIEFIGIDERARATISRFLMTITPV